MPLLLDPNQYQPGYPSGAEAGIKRCHEGDRRRPKVCLPGHNRPVRILIIKPAAILTLLSTQNHENAQGIWL
jgi:hypothetical protein